MRSAWLLIPLSVVVGCGRPAPVEEPEEPEEVVVYEGAEPGKTALKPTPLAPTTPADIPSWATDTQRERADPLYLPPPADGGAWPWAVAPAPPEPDAAVTWAFGPDFGGHALAGLALDPVGGRAVVGTLVRDGKQTTTRVTWLDLKTGRAGWRWEVPGHFEPLDLHPDGRRLLVSRRDGPAAPTRVELWAVGQDEQLNRRWWTPDPEGKADESGHGAVVQWAAFVGTRAATLTARGRAAVWELDGLTRLGWLDAVAAVPAVTPDRTRAVFLTRQGVALIDPEKPAIVGVRKAGPVPEHPVLAVRPDGQALAVVGTGRINTLDLTTGEAAVHRVGDLKTNYLGRHAPVGWAGRRHLFVGNQLFDPTIPMPVWEYGNADWAKPAGRRVWALAKTKDGKEGALAAHTLPHQGLDAAVGALAGNDKLYTLRPGDGVAIDVAGVPAGHREKVRVALEKRVRAAGFVPQPGAAASVVASVDKEGVQRWVTYHYLFGGGSTTLGYVQKYARVKLVKGDKVLWTDQGSHEPPATISGRNAVITMAGEPDYDLFSEAKLPEVVRGPVNYTKFGSLRFTPRGFLVTPVEWVRASDRLGPAQPTTGTGRVDHR